MSVTRLTIDEVTARLGVKRETVYAYVSRGLLRSEPMPDKRGSTFAADEVDRLAARARPRRRPLPGTGIDVVLDTGVTRLSDGFVGYRGHDIGELMGRHRFEAVAELLWTGELGDGRPWAVPAAAEATVRSALTALPSGAGTGDRLRLAVTAAAAADPLRHDLRPTAVVVSARSLIAAVTAALAPVAARPAPIARRLLAAMAPGAPARWSDAVDAALVALADHELATSTLGARVAASTRADPVTVVLAGLAVLSGPLHGTASVAVHRLLLDAEDDAASALSTRLRQDGPLPGFGHPVHHRADPRVGPILDAIRTAAPTGAPRARLAAAERLAAMVVERAPTVANVDFALAALGYAAGLPVGSTELLFSVARMAGWIAHALEEYGEVPLRFRARARWQPHRLTPPR